MADRLAAVLATQTLAVVGMPWDESTVGILSVLVFGAGTDYALLLISRYRDELKSHEDRYVAMRRALRRTAEAVLSSAATVVVGRAHAAALARSRPRAGSVWPVPSASWWRPPASCWSCLPALVLFGRWVFWPVVPRVGQPTLVETSGSFWGRVGRRRRPRARSP